MQTLSFIGSEKNAGKTTALNRVYRLFSEKGSLPVCLTAIGINGETTDSFDGRPKPSIPVFRGSLFVTAEDRLKAQSGAFAVVETFRPPRFSKPYVLARAMADFPVVIEGPNHGNELLRMKEVMENMIPEGRLLIDGSIDRRFLAHPRITDAFFVSLSLTKDPGRKKRNSAFIRALCLKTCSSGSADFLNGMIAKETRTLWLEEDGTLHYHGKKIPFLDSELKAIAQKDRKEKRILYLNGVMSDSLFRFFSAFSRLTIVLDNFTLYQDHGFNARAGRFCPEIFLLHPVRAAGIFIKKEPGAKNLTGLPSIPTNVPVMDLYREDFHESLILSGTRFLDH